MSETNNCPKCGAERDEAADGVEWKCGSWMRRDTFEQGDLCEAWVQVAALSAAKEQAERERDEAKERSEKYKAYTHKRMDDGGVPHTVPESPHTAAGCRIGGRFDWLFAELSRARFEAAENKGKYEGTAIVSIRKANELDAATARLTAAEAEVRALRVAWKELRETIETRRDSMNTFCPHTIVADAYDEMAQIVERLSAALLAPAEKGAWDAS